MKDILIKKTIILLFCFLPLKPAQALMVKHFFDTFVGPFNIAKVNFEYRLEKNTYAITSYIETDGTVGVLYRFIGKYATNGEFLNKRLITHDYFYQSQTRFSKRNKKIIYNEKGEPLQAIYNKDGRKKIKQLSQEKAAFYDLQSVFAFMVRQFFYTHSCNFKTTLFDGRKFFDVEFGNEGEEIVEKNKYSPFSGKAKKCSMYISKKKEDGDDTLWQTMSSAPIHFWIMNNTENNLPFIAKILVENTPFGDINAYTTRVEVKK